MNIHATLIGKIVFLVNLQRSEASYVCHKILFKAINHWRDRTFFCASRLLPLTSVKTLKYKICDLFGEFFGAAANDTCIQTKSIKGLLGATVC